MSEFVVTTVLEFSNRYEGQALHVGDRESCESTADLISALAYSGAEPILSSRLLILPRSECPDLAAGERWRQEKAGAT